MGDGLLAHCRAVAAELLQLGGDRTAVREQTVAHALKRLLEALA